MESPQPPDGNCTEPVRLPFMQGLRGDGAVTGATVPFLRVRPPRGFCAMSPTTCLRATDLPFFKFV